MLAVGVLVGLLVGVLVSVGVMLAVGVPVGVMVGVGVDVRVMVTIAVLVGVIVGVVVLVGVMVGVGVDVRVMVTIAVLVGVIVGVVVLVGVMVGLGVDVRVMVTVAVLVGVIVGVVVLVGVMVGVVVLVGVIVGVVVLVGVIVGVVVLVGVMVAVGVGDDPFVTFRVKGTVTSEEGLTRHNVPVYVPVAKPVESKVTLICSLIPGWRMPMSGEAAAQGMSEGQLAPAPSSRVQSRVALAVLVNVKVCVRTVSDACVLERLAGSTSKPEPNRNAFCSTCVRFVSVLVLAAALAVSVGVKEPLLSSLNGILPSSTEIRPASQLSLMPAVRVK